MAYFCGKEGSGNFRASFEAQIFSLPPWRFVQSRTDFHKMPMVVFACRGELKVKGLPKPPAFRCDEVTPVGNLRVVLWVWRPEFMSHSPSLYGLVENGV